MIRLDGSAGPVPVTAPMAVVSGWLDDRGSSARAPETEPGAQDAVGEVVSDHEGARRPWALSPPQPAPGHGQLGSDALFLEVRLLDDRLGERLLSACRPGTEVRLGRWWVTVTEEPALLEHAGWDVLGKGTAERAWQLRVTSPATFRSRNRTSPWADPVTVARGLQRRWQLLHPSTAPDIVDGGARSVWVSDVDGHSEVVVLRGQVVSGFVGRLRFVSDGTPEEAGAFSALMGFAVFAGVGSHTTYGFGAVAPEDTWQPPTTRHRP